MRTAPVPDGVEDILWPPAADAEPVPTGDPEARFVQIIFAVRLGTTALSMALAASAINQGHLNVIVWSSIVLTYNGFRLWQPLRDDGDTASLIRLLVEVGLSSLAIVFTGAWNSPLVYPILTSIIVAGFSRGFGFALRIAIAVSVAVGTAQVIQPVAGQNPWAISTQWSIELVVVAATSGYARRIFGEARQRHTLTLSRLDRLTDANELLTSLHQVAQALPASLDLEEALDGTMGRVRELFRFDAAALLLFDETDGQWEVARWDGRRLPNKVAQRDLPAPLRRAAATRRVIAVPDVFDEGGGLSPKTRSGIYGVLTARDSLVGLLAIESLEPEHFTERDVELLNGFLEPAALALDNARVFGRLRTVGADEERTRIARDLHDRIGQSLAYLAFELDRIVKANERETDIGPSLNRLRNDVRGVIAEVRDTLYDLRTDVSDTQDFTATMQAFLDRVRDRSGLRTRVVAQATGRLPLLRERELWRIAQEAVINIERHANATSISVTWRTDGSRALLEVIDDGKGFPTGRAGRLDSYGITGMRERAASVGATFEINGVEGRGTVVRCRLDGI